MRFLLKGRKICLIHFKTMGWNIFHSNIKPRDMTCMPNKVMSYTISLSTNMLKFNMVKSFCKILCLFY